MTCLLSPRNDVLQVQIGAETRGRIDMRKTGKWLRGTLRLCCRPGPGLTTHLLVAYGQYEQLEYILKADYIRDAVGNSLSNWLTDSVWTFIKVSPWYCVSVYTIAFHSWRQISLFIAVPWVEPQGLAHAGQAFCRGAIPRSKEIFWKVMQVVMFLSFQQCWRSYQKNLKAYDFC